MAADTDSRCVGRTLVVVLCMHRSGSSFVSSVLQKLGMSLGPFQLLGAAKSNKYGHFEAAPFYLLNQKLQTQVFGFPDDLPNSPESLAEFRRSEGRWSSDVVIAPAAIKEGESLIHQLVESGTVSGFKDPRTVLLWPFWSQVFSRFPGLRIVPVFTARSPHEIAMSLFMRGKGEYSYRDALDVTAVHFQQMHRIMESCPDGCAVVRYSPDVVAQDLRRAAELCGLDWSPDVLDQLYDAGCRHHLAAVVSHPAQEAFERLGMPSGAVDLARIEEDAARREAIIQPRIEQLREENGLLVRELDARHREHEQALERFHREISELSEARQRAEREAARLNTELNLVTNSRTWRLRRKLIDTLRHVPGWSRWRRWVASRCQAGATDSPRRKTPSTRPDYAPVDRAAFVASGCKKSWLSSTGFDWGNLGPGWSHVEPDRADPRIKFRWSQREASVHLWNHFGRGTVEMQVLGCVGRGEGPQVFDVSINDGPPCQFRLWTNDWQTIRVDYVGPPGPLEITIWVENPRVPGRVFDDGQPHTAGIGLRQVQFLPAGEQPLTWDGISVIIPTYNRCQKLLRVLQSLESQTLDAKRFEVIVVDDGSTDATPEMIGGYRQNSPLRITYVRQSNKLQAAARNRGIALAREPLLMFIGDDIVPSPDLLRQHLDFHRQHNCCGDMAVVGRIKWQGDLCPTPFMKYINDRGPQFAFALMGHPGPWSFDCFYASNVSLPREMLQKLGRAFDEDFKSYGWEDAELGYRLELAGMRLLYNADAVAYHDHPTDVRQFCQRQHQVGQCSRLLFEKHPELEPYMVSAGRMRRWAGMRGGWRLVEWATSVWDGKVRARLPSLWYSSLLSARYTQGVVDGRAVGQPSDAAEECDIAPDDGDRFRGPLSLCSVHANGEDSTMQPSERIDILLATHNGERFIEQQLESVVEQMDRRCRLLIRDDASSDGTVAIVRRFIERRPEQIVLLEDGGPRLGACGCFGRLMEHSNADYVTLCDQDDVWLPGRISKPLERIQAVEWELGRQTPVLAHTDLVVADEDLHPIAQSFWSYGNLDALRGNGLNRILVQNVVTGCATMVNRALAQRASPIPSAALMHDWWLALVAAAFGRIEAVPATTVLYRQHHGNRLGATRYGWRYVIRYARDALCRGAIGQWHLATQPQALEFHRRYADQLPPQQRELVAAYVSLQDAGFVDRRMQILRHGFFKTGPLRNLGWLLKI
jgi:glycosyltransferase involved in cell wall biosynthesis